VSPLLVIAAAVFGASAAVFLPRIADRFATGSARPWVVVPIGAVLGALPAVVVGPSLLLPGYLVAELGLLLALIDLRCLRLPDRLVVALAVAGAGPAVLLHPEHAGRALLAAGAVLAAYVILWFVAGGGLGLGDVKLAGALALILGFAGWPAVVLGLIVPHLINGPVAVVLWLTRRVRVIAFGPALLVGALVALAAAPTAA
jgi:leader peptidase (prepilin peptidase) / N-methyltransferase